VFLRVFRCVSVSIIACLLSKRHEINLMTTIAMMITAKTLKSRPTIACRQRVGSIENGKQTVFSIITIIICS